MDNTSPDSLTPKEIDQLVTPDDMEADRKEAEARRAPGGAGAADADMAAEDDEKPIEPEDVSPLGPAFLAAVDTGDGASNHDVIWDHDVISGPFRGHFAAGFGVY